jgi:hypothetical protein
VIGASAGVAFDLGATPFPNTGFTVVPPPGGTTFTVASTGAYEYNFYVVGAPSTNVPLEFAIFVNGVSQGPAHEFRSETSLATVPVVRGQGIIQLTAGDLVNLHNRTNVGTDTVAVTSLPFDGEGEATANRTLTLKKLN